MLFSRELTERVSQGKWAKEKESAVSKKKKKRKIYTDKIGKLRSQFVFMLMAQ